MGSWKNGILKRTLGGFCLLAGVVAGTMAQAQDDTGHEECDVTTNICHASGRIHKYMWRKSTDGTLEKCHYIQLVHIEIPGYDCDDAAYCADDVLEDMGFRSWQVKLVTVGTATHPIAAHALNIVEVDSHSVNTKYCLYEPQRDAVIGCWHQSNSESEPEIPPWFYETIEDWYQGQNWNWIPSEGLDPSKTDIWDDGLCTDAGEPCFTENAEACEIYTDATGYEPPDQPYAK